MEVKVKQEEGVLCSRCLDFQNDIIAQKDTEIEVFKCKNIQLEDEVRVLKSEIDELHSHIVDHEKKVDDLMVENSVLECEKGKAERDVEAWKAKCKELELQLAKIRKGVDSGNKNEEVNEDEDRSAGTFRTKTLSKHSTDSEQESRREVSSRARKCSNGGNLQKNIFPVTPCSRSSVAADVKSDSDDDQNCLQFKKRRVVANRVTSDSESDDNVPLSKLMSKTLPDLDGDTNPIIDLNGSSSPENLNRSTRKRRLIKQGNRGKEKHAENSPRRKSARLSNRKIVTVDDDDDESDKDECDTESLDSFIVADGADDSEHDSASSSEEILENDDTSSGDSRNESEGSMEYGEIMSSLRREKIDKLKWEYEADMLADFGKSPELCMKAVCALYRQQTSDEQNSKVALFHNGRGFSRFDATSGSNLADFLTGGDSQGDVIKTVEELLEFSSNGIKECRKLATHYSKQLFQIYENGEDPYLGP